MKIRIFRHALKNGWEVGFIGKHLQLRIARYQFALWRMKDDSAIFNFCW